MWSKVIVRCQEKLFLILWLFQLFSFINSWILSYFFLCYLLSRFSLPLPFLSSLMVFVSIISLTVFIFLPFFTIIIILCFISHPPLSSTLSLHPLLRLFLFGLVFFISSVNLCFYKYSNIHINYVINTCFKVSLIF